MEAGSRGEFDFTIDVRDSAGHVPPDTEYYRAVTGKQDSSRPMLVITRNGGPRLVKPHGALADSIQLDKLYDLSKPDKYTIQLERIDDATKAIVKSNKITVTMIRISDR